MGQILLNSTRETAGPRAAGLNAETQALTLQDRSQGRPSAHGKLDTQKAFRLTHTLRTQRVELGFSSQCLLLLSLPVVPVLGGGCRQEAKCGSERVWKAPNLAFLTGKP